jgi:carbamate kinase
VDKDLASALLAQALRADKLLLLTDVAAVYEDWGSKHPRAIGRVTPRELSTLEFEAGSMGPKVAAACEFADAGGSAAIGALVDAARLQTGECGTQIEG